MRLKRVKNCDEIINNSVIVVKDPTNNKGKWKEVFNNANPIDIEIGMGKGNFVIQMAKNNPDVNYIGIEKQVSVLVRAIQKIREDKPNLYFVGIDALELNNIFDKNEIRNIYLNFSDPWPKERHYKRRLTYKSFLDVYKYIMNENGRIYLKTDNIGLFNFSLESFRDNGFNIKNITNDLHFNNDNVVMTEYEEKFVSLGVKINYLEANVIKDKKDI